jgi:hypothetical protein
MNFKNYNTCPHGPKLRISYHPKFPNQKISSIQQVLNGKKLQKKEESGPM